MSGPRHARSEAKPAALAVMVAAGLSDLATGLALVAAPALVLSLLGIARPPLAPAEGAIFLRFVGAFVAGVGAAYLYPFVPGLRARLACPACLATIAEVTALLRTGVALFLAGAVATGALGPPWLLVAGFDGALAALQVWMLRKGRFGRAAG